MSGNPTRRDFFRALAPGGEPSEEPVAAEGVLRCLSRAAMAGQFEICFNVQQYPGGDEAVLDALDELAALEAQLSVFRPDSELSQINRTAADGPVEVEPRLFALLESALRVGRETAGAYDITSAPLWEVWGFARRAGAIPDPAQLAEARARVGGQLIELDADRRTVRFLREGVRLNLGSIGKGYAADRCAQRLHAAGIHDFLINAGGSSVLAHGGPHCHPERSQCHSERSEESGSPSTAANDCNGWLVGVRHPTRQGQRLGQLRLYDQALGTSGAQFQSFYHQGRRYGHILDPRTGWPADALLSATAVTPTAAEADALSTALFVLGPTAAREYCAAHPEIAAVLVCPGEAGLWRLETIGLREDQWTPTP